MLEDWAEIDHNNIVKRVLVVAVDEVGDPETFLTTTFGGRWLKTCKYTTWGKHREGGIPFRKNFAGPGMFYDEKRDAFRAPFPSFASWVLDEDRCIWVSPIPRPEDEEIKYGYRWNERKIRWDKDHIVAGYKGELTDEDSRLYHRS